MILCLWFGVRYYRVSKPGPLLVVFYRDGTLYFVVVAIMSVTNAIIAKFIPVRYSFPLGPAPLSKRDHNIEILSIRHYNVRVSFPVS